MKNASMVGGVLAATAWLVTQLAVSPVDSTSPGELVDELRGLETLKAAACARQAAVAVALDATQRAAQGDAGVPAARRGKGVAEQIALARRESPTSGSRLLGLAKALHHELPATRALLVDGLISEWRATIVAAETACLDAELRSAVDAEIAPGLAGMSDRQVRAAARSAAYRLDPKAVLTRGRHAQSQRYVSLRPAPDTMTYLSAYLPVREGVACYAALRRAADAARATGDPRGAAQVMADTLTARLTGREQPDSVPLEVQVVMTDRSLFETQERAPGVIAQGSGEAAQGSGEAAQGSGKAALGSGKAAHGGDEAAHVVGYGPVPAPLAREWIRSTTADVFLRRWHADADTGQVGYVDPRRRLFPVALRRLIVARDRYCRTPWCGAPIRHIDHISSHSRGGSTTLDNGQGLCERCNQAKTAPGWAAVTVPDPAGLGRHVVETRTPTGHNYRSIAPPVGGPGRSRDPAGLAVAG